MDKQVFNLKIREGNIIEIPKDVLEKLGVKQGNEIKLVYSKQTALVLNDSKYEEYFLNKK